MTCRITFGSIRLDILVLSRLSTFSLQVFVKAVNRKSDELSSHDFAEFNLVVNLAGHGNSEKKSRKMKHVIPSEKRARIIDR